MSLTLAQINPTANICPLCMHDVTGEFNCRKCMNIRCQQKFHGICATNSGKSDCPKCHWKYVAYCGEPGTPLTNQGGKKRKTRKARKARKTKKNRKTNKKKY
jgi:hypothetical protein